MTKKRWRIIRAVLAVLAGVPIVATVAWLIWWPQPPAGAPRIGLSMESSFVVQRPTYEAALARAGGESVLLTPTDDPDAIEAMLDRVDALLLTGGDDIDPAVYDGDPQAAGATDRRRDEFEIRLIRGALDRGMPIVGVCRGVQIFNVAHGGTVRNLRDDKALAARHGIDVDSFAAHDVRIEPGTHLARVVGDGTVRVNSFHGQAVDRVGDALRACAVADDGVVEAVEHPHHPLAIAVQWHPEIASLTDTDALAMFKALIEHAACYRDRRNATPVSGARIPTASQPTTSTGK